MLRFYRHRLTAPDPYHYYRAKRRRKRRRHPSNPLLPLLFFVTVVILLATKLFAHHDFRPHIPPSPPPRPPSPVQADRTSAQPQLDTMRPPQFGQPPSKVYVNGNALRLLQDEAPPESHLKYLPFFRPPPRPPSRDAVANPLHEPRPITRAEAATRTCYHSARTGHALCVHVPLCIRHSAIVYLADTLRCAAYSNVQGKMATLSMARCVQLEKELEAAAEMDPLEQKGSVWLEALQKDGNVLWFEGDSVFVRLSRGDKSVPHFADRIFMLHHIVQHPERYGMGAISNIVIAAHQDVAKKIRYTKSWHHGLLSAIVYPNKLIYAHKNIRHLVTSTPNKRGEIRVFVPAGLWDVAKGKQVPCFRRAALPGSVKGQFFLTSDVYPGVVEPAPSADKAARYRDADVFRTLLFQSLGHQGPPRIKKHILYLHRAITRTFTDSGLRLLQTTLEKVAKHHSFSYQMLNVAGMTFPQQIQSVAGAGVVLGVHGTQMLNTLFLPAGASVVEIFPYNFVNDLFRHGSGAGLAYRQHHVVHGEDFGGLHKYGPVEECKRKSRECRRWYQSDGRRLEFGHLDAARVGKLVEEAVADVEKAVAAV